jgi:DNA-binding NarL/FixJ family response regulator
VPKASKDRRPGVCLLFSHPLVQAEFQRVLANCGYRVQSRRLQPTLAQGAGQPSLPRAPLYLIDAHAPRQTTEILVAAIRDRYPNSRQIVVAEKFSEASAFALLRLGAKGLLSYVEAREQLPRSLETVGNGGFWVPRKLLSRFVDSILGAVRGHRIMSGPADLSRREREALDLLLENLSNKEIASRLNISERTVKFHVSSLLAKFGVRRRSDLILVCYQSRPVAP